MHEEKINNNLIPFNIIKKFTTCLSLKHKTIKCLLIQYIKVLLHDVF